MPLLSTIQSRPLRWLWPNRIALGKVTLLLGPTGVGKSLVTLDMAARVSSGKPWFTSPNEANPAGGVVLLTGEEDLSDTVCPRLEAAGPNLERITTLPSEDDQPLTLPDNIQAIEDAIKNMPECRLVIIDPLSSYLPQTSARKQPPLKTILKPLADLAARTGVAIVAVMPINEATSKATTQRTIANLTAQAAPYSVWQLTEEADPNQEQPNQHWLLPLRNNNAPPGTALTFQPQAAPNGSAAIAAWQPTPAAQAPDPRRKPARHQTNNSRKALFNSAFRTPHSELFNDDPDPYEGLPSLEDNYPEPMNFHPPR
jgi:putative DNA primase/helicase